jgi:hypothetical protein
LIIWDTMGAIQKMSMAPPSAQHQRRVARGWGFPQFRSRVF